VFDRHIAAMRFCKEQRESNPDILLTVRLGETDIKILSKTDLDSNWNQIELPKNLPKFNNNVVWEGLSQSKSTQEIEEFSPMKGALPSEQTVAEMVKQAEKQAKRKDVSPLSNANHSKKSK